MPNVIALDCMGGDLSPQAQVEGAVLAVREMGIPIHLVGDAPAIEAELRRLGATNLGIPVCPAEEVIGVDEQPSTAVRRKKRASLVVAHQLVKDGEAAACVSSGNTGALLAAGLFIIGRLNGVERPALAPMLPTLDGTGFLLLDAGATAEGKAEYMLQYGLMGSLYRQLVHGIAAPRVGLINVGNEDSKGNELYRQAFALLKAAPLNFIGNVEGRDLLLGATDVLVCDGFTGNIVLKCIEGAGSFFSRVLREELMASSRGMLAGFIASPTLDRLKQKLDYSEYGGAPLLGLKGVSFKAHGSANARAIYLALNIAHSYIASDMAWHLSKLFNPESNPENAPEAEGSIGKLVL